jgi:hypothetical protein
MISTGGTSLTGTDAKRWSANGVVCGASTRPSFLRACHPRGHWQGSGHILRLDALGPAAEFADSTILRLPSTAPSAEYRVAEQRNHL